MGRKPLKADVATMLTSVRLTADTRSRIEALVGPNRLATFIREAVDAELTRRERSNRRAPPP